MELPRGKSTKRKTMIQITGEIKTKMVMSLMNHPKKTKRKTQRERSNRKGTMEA